MNDRDERPFDFTVLDPTADPKRFSRWVDATMAQAAEELALRRAPWNPILQLASWRRPLLAAAAVVAAVSATVFTQVHVPETATTAATDGVAEAVGVPVELAQWIWDETVPTIAELVTNFEE
jgi:hypothetical protein